MDIFEDLFSPHKNNSSKGIGNAEKFGIIEEEEKENKKIKKRPKEKKEISHPQE